MEQTVYVDLLFAVNFCMDFQCLFLTARLLHRPFALGRSLLASALGALYACAALFLPVGGALAFAADLCAGLLMCALVFWAQEEKKWRFLIPFGLYFGVSAAVGGVMSAFSGLLSDLRYTPSKTGGSTLSFALFALLGGLATFLWGRLCQRRAKGKCVRLHLSYEGRELSVEAFVDTANHLCDPVGGRPVVIIDRAVAGELLPEALLNAARKGAAGLSLLPPALARRVRMIPAATVTGRGLLLAIAPDRAFLDAGRGAHAVELLLAPAPLSDAAQGHKALLPPALLTE
ncbi:MAG: sigma-E processing peptidase SpoIIGA [Clostridia bacterium]|nr:sigma-E processing peptidase SpoIIGA [Clostridia bacterium]